tara:strand:- start:398 stop:1006 length:609 start_codon:yes stop_codon:yes gene_type:complete
MIKRVARKMKSLFKKKRTTEPWFSYAKNALQYSGDEFNPHPNRKLVGVEVGAHLGNHCGRILKNLNIEKISLIDPWTAYDGDADFFLSQKFQDECFETVKEKFGNNDKVEIVKSTSLNASKMFKDHKLDFVYIDGNHQYESVIEDLNIWYPKVKYRGIIAGDDYKYKFPGVIRAVNEFSNLHNFHVELLDQGQFVILKTKHN